MPVYEYKCIMCENIFSAIRSVKRRAKPPACPICGFPAKMVPSAPSLETNLGTKLRKKLAKKKAPGQ